MDLHMRLTPHLSECAKTQTSSHSAWIGPRVLVCAQSLLSTLSKASPSHLKTTGTNINRPVLRRSMDLGCGTAIDRPASGLFKLGVRKWQARL